MCPRPIHSARGAATSRAPLRQGPAASKSTRRIRFVSGQVLAPHVSYHPEASLKYSARSSQVTRVDQLPANFKAPLSCQIKVVPHPGNQLPLRQIDLEAPDFDKDDPRAPFALPNDWVQRIFDGPKCDTRFIHPLILSPLFTAEQKYFFYHMHVTGRLQTRAQWVTFLEAVAHYPEHREWVHGILSVPAYEPYYQQTQTKLDALSQTEKLWAEFYHHVSPGIPPDLESMDFAPQDALLHMVHFIGDWYSEHIHHESHFESMLSFLIEQVLKSKTPFPEFWLDALFKALDERLKNGYGHPVFMHLSKLPLLHHLYTQHRSKINGTEASVERTKKGLVKSLLHRILHDRNRFISEDDGLIFLYNEIQKALAHYHELEDKSEYEHPAHFESLIRVYKDKFLYDKNQSGDRGKYVGFAMVHEYLMTTDADFAKEQATLLFKTVFGDTPPNYSQSFEFKLMKQSVRLHTAQQRVGSDYRHLSEDANWILNTEDYPKFKNMNDLAEFCQKWGLLPDREAKKVTFGVNTILRRVARKGFEAPQHQAIKGYSRLGPKEASKPQLVTVIKRFIRSGHHAIYTKADEILEGRRFSHELYFQSIAHPAQETSYQIKMTKVEDQIPPVIPMSLTPSPFVGIYRSDISLVPHEDGIQINLEIATDNIDQLGLPDDGTGFGTPTAMSMSPRRTHVSISLNKAVQFTLSSKKSVIHINQTNWSIIHPIHPEDPLLEPWIERIARRLAQAPFQSIVKVTEQVLSESFEYDDQLTDDIDYRAFIETFDLDSTSDVYALWQRMHQVPDHSNKKVLARGRDLELSLLAQAILASLHIESKILFARRTHPVIRENHDARTGPLRSFVVIPNKKEGHMEYIILDPAVNDPDRLEAMQNNDLGELYQNERLVEKELSTLKTNRLRLENEDPHHVSNRLILSSALVVGLGVIGGVHLGAYLVSERVNATMSQQNNPNLTPLSDVRKRSNKWDLEAEQGNPLPQMIVQSYNYDFLGRQSASPAKLHPVLDSDSQHTVTVRPHDPDLITYFADQVELYPIGGQKVQEQAFGPAVTYSVSNTNLTWHDQISDPVDARLLQLEVPEEWVADRLGPLSELRRLPIAERIAIAEYQIQDDFVYLYDMGQDPLNVEFSNQWDEKDPDQLQKYWQHIFNPHRQFEDLSPGQCKEMSFVLVQYLRALSVPATYADGYGVSHKTQRTTAPHRNAVAFVPTDHGLTPQLVLQTSLIVDNEHPQENKKTEDSVLSQKTKTTLNIGLSLFMSLWGFFELHSGLLNRRRKKKLEDIEKKIKATKKNINTAKNAVDEALDNQALDTTPQPAQKSQTPKPALALTKVPVEIPRTLSNKALDEALFFLGNPVPLEDRSNTTFLLDQLESTLQKQFCPHAQIRMNVPGKTFFSKERLKKQARKRMREKALEWQQILEHHNFQSEESKELVQSLLEQILADDFPTPEFVYDFEIDSEDYLVTAARLGLTIIR